VRWSNIRQDDGDAASRWFLVRRRDGRANGRRLLARALVARAADERRRFAAAQETAVALAAGASFMTHLRQRPK